MSTAYFKYGGVFTPRLAGSLPHNQGKFIRNCRPRLFKLKSNQHQSYNCKRDTKFLRNVNLASQRSAKVTSSSSSSSIGLFPAGQRQAKVTIPAYIIELTPQDNLGDAELSDMVQNGLSGVILLPGQGGATSDGDMYNAAVRIKEQLRGRANLLIMDRTDIATAVKADGVILSHQGVPTIIARQSLSLVGSGLVGRVVHNPAQAATSAADGANLLILKEDGTENSEQIALACRTEQKSGSIPVLLHVQDVLDTVQTFVSSGCIEGLIVPYRLVQQVAQKCGGNGGAKFGEAVNVVIEQLRQNLVEQDASQKEQDRLNRSSAMRVLLSESREELALRERQYLADLQEFIREAVPQMDEVSLLKDSIRALDELFLLVIVGEFNSGKSSVVNALLGGPYLPTGILPTTNEICVLKYADAENFTQDADGFFTRTIPAPLLKELNIVDTPGTNVVIERQQRLTEEYVPRADLVIFVMSVDRPFSESEVEFLRYIKQWGKKIIFVLNKSDLLENPTQIEEVVGFIEENAQRLLGVPEANVFALSAKDALDAKMSFQNGESGVLSSVDVEGLAEDYRWVRSGFGSLERFVYEFLIGGPEAKGKSESVRLKLQTPLSVADALIAAAQRQLDTDLQTAKDELSAVESVLAQLDNFREEMRQDSEAQAQEVQSMVTQIMQRSDRFIDGILRMSNLGELWKFFFGGLGQDIGSQIENQVMSGKVGEIKGLVDEHSKWLRENCEAQVANYRTFAEEMVYRVGVQQQEHVAQIQQRLQQQQVQTQQSVQQQLDELNKLQPSDLGIFVEGQLQDSVKGSAGAVIGAIIIGAVLVAILPETLEDLMAILIAGLAAYAAILNLPYMRQQMKGKLRGTYRDVEKAVTADLQQSLESQLQQSESQVKGYIQPVQELVLERLEQLEQGQIKLKQYQEQLVNLQREASNVD